MFAEVVLTKTSSFLDKTYDYSIPATLLPSVKIGIKVEIPFGKRTTQGYVVGLKEESSVPGIKAILRIVDETVLFGPNVVSIDRWLADYYHAFFLRALNLFLPPKGKAPITKNQISSNYQPPKFQLTQEQTAALNTIFRAIDENRPEVFLLHGVTGSGKTEVYLRAVEHLLLQGKSAITLEPEIGMTPQLIERFQERFGDNCVVLHSHLTLKERRAAWWRVAAGQGKIVLGTRLALFAPVKNLGLIVIDEEYENSYKSDMSPRYNTRDVAQKFGVPVVLGSATPAVETYYLADMGKYHKLVLSHRIDHRPLPPVTVVDMRRELAQKNFSMLSSELRDSLQETLARGEQAVLFINKRGYYTFVMCRECGKTLECPHCAASLIYSSQAAALACNYCGYSIKQPPLCPNCQSSLLKFFGGGTQKLEDEINKLFPQARILRVDQDSVKQRGSHEAIFHKFSRGEADILLGTQMVTKGLDLPKVTLVGVVAADGALYQPDFRAAERTFQLITQVAGRAGRHHLPGKVIVQSYNPSHYAIIAAAKHDYQQFYQQEIEQRREMIYPPFTNLISIIVEAASKKAGFEFAQDLARGIQGTVLGPIPATIARARGKWRFQILLKGVDPLGLQLPVPPTGINISLDVDPASLA